MLLEFLLQIYLQVLLISDDDWQLVYNNGFSSSQKGLLSGINGRFRGNWRVFGRSVVMGFIWKTNMHFTYC